MIRIMTTPEFASFVIDNAEFQLRACLTGLTDDQYKSMPVEGMMSAKDLVMHLMDCYQAVEDMANGVEHQWGSYASPDTGIDFDIAKLFEARAKAASIAESKLGEKPSYARDFIIAHDYYHVGQICWMRQKLDPSWTTYEIYPSE